MGRTLAARRPDQGWEGDRFVEGNENLVCVIPGAAGAVPGSALPGQAGDGAGAMIDEERGRMLMSRAADAMGDGENAPVQPPLRHPWSESDPEVLIVAGESAVKKHASYASAKAGSLDAAWVLVSEFMPRADRAIISGALRGGAKIVSVHAFEGVSVNRIPVAMAQWIAGEFGAAAERVITQINRVGHTGASGWARMANQALFAGEVERGTTYLLVDDFVGQGGTLANLRGHLLARGAKVAGMVALTGNSAVSQNRPGSLDSDCASEQTWKHRILVDQPVRLRLRAAHPVRGRVPSSGRC